MRRQQTSAAPAAAVTRTAVPLSRHRKFLGLIAAVALVTIGFESAVLLKPFLTTAEAESIRVARSDDTVMEPQHSVDADAPNQVVNYSENRAGHLKASIAASSTYGRGTWRGTTGQEASAGAGAAAAAKDNSVPPPASPTKGKQLPEHESTAVCCSKSNTQAEYDTCAGLDPDCAGDHTGCCMGAPRHLPSKPAGTAEAAGPPRVCDGGVEDDCSAELECPSGEFGDSIMDQPLHVSL